MTKKIVVKQHIRDGVLVEEHEREVSGDGHLTLQERLERDIADREKQKALFGDK